MKVVTKCGTFFAVLIALAALAMVNVASAFAAPGGTPQASITLTNCNSEICNANNTEWTLDKTPASQTFTGTGITTNTITWTVTADRGATSDNFLKVNGVITVTNTGSAPATIGNIVVSLQKPATKNPQKAAWVSVAADCANAFADDAATTCNIVAAASQENPTVNAAQGASNYTVSGAQGTFIETAGSGTLEFTDASSNTIFSLIPQVSLAPGASITLLYTATFDNTILGLPVGSLVRAEAIVSFGNAGARGGSGATATNIDINGNGSTDADEAHVRSVPCRVTEAIPALQNGNDIVTLSDTSGDVVVTGSNVALSNFSTDIGGGSGTELVSADATHSVFVDETCTPSASETVTNTAHLDGESSSVTVQGPQIGTDPTTGAPIYATFEFACVTGVDLDAAANAGVSCELPPPSLPNACTYTKGAYGATCNGGNPGCLFDTNYPIVFSGGLTIGIVGASNHDATWTATVPGPGDLKTYFTSAATGPSTALTVDTLNATSTNGGSLPRQTAALTLNIGFAIGSDNTVGTGDLGSLKLCNLAEGSPVGTFTLSATQAAALNGKSVSDVLTDANNALGGNGLPSYVGFFGDLNQLVTALNESFDNCTASSFAVANLCVAP